ncbi:hypothetical protein BKA93DRAFT_744557 [Sparassis latifolia]
MDILSTHPPAGQTSPGLLSDFPPPNPSFGVDPRLTSLDGLDGSHQLVSSPSATSSSTGPSHAPSPAMNGMGSSYSVGSSSLASALDGMAARSRSGSSASPANLTSSTSEIGFSSGGSGPSTSSHDSGFQFMSGFENTPPQPAEENSQDVPEGAHLLVLGDMLKNIARTANSGSQACSMGQTTDARDIVDMLKKNVLLVAELVAAMHLGTSGVSSNMSSPHCHPAVASSAPMAAAAQDVAQQQHINGLQSYGSPPLDTNAMLDMSDISRKRCASSVAGDRVPKIMKLEPHDDAPLSQLPAPIIPPTAIPISPVYSYPPPMPSIPPSASMGEIPAIPPPSIPPTVTPSRPPTPGGIPALHHIVPDGPPPQSLHSMHFAPLDPMLTSPPDFNPQSSITPGPSSLPANVFDSVPLVNTIWPDARVPIARHHSHSVSSGSVLSSIPPPAIAIAQLPPMQFSSSVFPSPTRTTHLAQTPVPTPPVPSDLAVRASRSSSMSNLHAANTPNPFAFGLDMQPVPLPPSVEMLQSRPSTSGLQSRATTPDYDDEMDGLHESSDEGGENSQPYQYMSPAAGSSDSAENTASPEGTSSLSRRPSQRRMSRASPSAEGGASSSAHGNEVPQEYRVEVERIFFEFLNATCSNLDATDAKGEPIHQTLMAKKMQRLDESPDFRPFKFRIQAFTNAFLEELARQGYPEEKIPMKKIRNFLWNQPFISRFNEEGKKSKSKGNHIWHVDAKKTESGWAFRPFRRKLAGTPPGVAYVGLRWMWTPRIWDPQASRSNMPVKYNSSELPSWLSWKDDVLSGIPTPDAQSCDVTVEARYIQDGKEEVLQHTVHIVIAPMASVDSTFVPSRRPSLAGELNPRRVLSDPAVTQTTPPRSVPNISLCYRSIMRAQTTLAPAVPSHAPDSQVVQVLTSAAQRVAQEAQSQVVASPNDAGPELQALAKQQHVLTVTAQAFNSKMAGDEEGSGTQSSLLTAAAQQVVLQAARQVVADRTVAAVSSGVVSPQTAASQVTVKDVSVATQSAVAQAVDMIGPLSSEVDVLMTASSLLQQQTRAPPPPPLLDPQLSALAESGRPHPAGTSPPGQFGIPAAVSAPSGAVFFPQS